MAAGDSLRKAADELRREAARHRAETERLERAATLREAGATGEDRVARALAELDPATTRVLHDRLLDPGQTPSNLDHIVVSPAGVFYIDAKNWSGAVNVRGDSLWQHKFASGGQNVNQDCEVDKVRWLAEQVSRRSGCVAEPVLCLAGDRADRFGDPVLVRRVHVVPVNRLVQWLSSRPAHSLNADVQTRAVDLSCLFPAAVDPGFTMPQFSAGKQPKRFRHKGKAPMSRALVVVVAMLGFVVLVPRILAMIGGGVTHVLSAAATPSAPKSTLTPAQLQALDDWRIRAGLYRDNAKPTALAYVPDSGLGRYSSDCRTQEVKVAVYRSALLKAPDAQLVSAAKQYDVATHQLLEACRKNQPVELHHADAAMTAAAAEVNLRYNRLIGRDPSAYNATRVL